jgi:hypothetical protein
MRWVGWKAIVGWVGTVLSNNGVGWVDEGGLLILFWVWLDSSWILTY